MEGSYAPWEDSSFVYPPNLASPLQVHTSCVDVTPSHILVVQYSIVMLRHRFFRADIIFFGISLTGWEHEMGLQILIDASNGASDYGNKFGEPLIQVSYFSLLCMYLIDASVAMLSWQLLFL